MARALTTLAIDLPRFALREPDGRVEFAISSGAVERLPRPMRVTRVLSAALGSIEGMPVTMELVRRLSSGTREWLLQRIGALFRPRNDWFEADCTACGARYDFPLDVAAMPAKPAGQTFPVVSVATSRGLRNFDVPNGADEETLAGDPGGDPRRRFAALCGLSDQAAGEADGFVETDLAAIDAALDEAAPQPSDQSASRCPNCGHPTVAAIDPLAFAFPSEIALLGEVHRIAARYHWTEDAILGLPTRRRRQYLSLIRADGRARQPARYP